MTHVAALFICYLFPTAAARAFYLLVRRIHQSNAVMALITHVLLPFLLSSAGRLTLQASSIKFMGEPDFLHLLGAERILLCRDYLLCHEGMRQVVSRFLLDASLTLIFLTASCLLLSRSDLTAIYRLLLDLRLVGLSEQSIDIAVVVLHEVYRSYLLLVLLLISCSVARQSPPRRI